MNHYYNYNNPQIGDIVYPAYTPVKAGKILEIDNEQYFHPNGKPQDKAFNLVTVLQSNGQTYQKPAINLKCFRDLVEDHELKAKKFQKIFNKIEKQ
jgi:hypothetical protein